MQGLTRTKRAAGLFPGMDRGNVLKTLRFMESRFASFYKSPQQSLRFETLDAADIAKAILPTDDSSWQWSPPGGGVTADPAQVLAELFERLVIRHEDKHPAVRRTDEEVWRPFEKALKTRDQNILACLHEQDLSFGSFHHRFEHAWQPERGPLHLLLPLSFDLLDPSEIVDKAIRWNGRIHQLRKAQTEFRAFLLIGKPSEPNHEAAYAEAKGVLESAADPERKIMPEDQSALFADEFLRSVLSSN